MPRSLVYRLMTKGGAIDALIDSGAELSLLSLDTVKKRGFAVEPLEDPLRIVFADQSEVLATQCVPSLLLSRGSWSDRLSHVVVVPNLSRPLFLGRDWLYRWNPVVDWVSGRLTVAGDGEPWVPKGDVSSSKKLNVPTRGVAAEEMTPSAFRKWLRTSTRTSRSDQAEAFLIIVRPLSINAATTTTAPPSTSSHPPLPPQMSAIMADYPKVFEEAEGVEPHPPVRHPIRLEDDARPSHVKPYRFTETQKNEMREQVSLLLQKGWIRPSSSPWGAPVLLVPKKDGTWRFCVDFRNLNAVTVRDSFPLPRIDDLLHKVGQATVFSKMDMQSGFHQVPMEPNSIETTAFSLPEAIQGSSHFEWIVMPFGLMNAPSTFQRLISKVLIGCETFTAAYIDDVLIFSTNEQQHKAHLRKVLTCLSNHNLRVKFKKCSFFKTEMPFLGHVLTKGSVKVEPEKIEALGRWRRPLTTVKQVRQFLGMASYYRMFVPNFASLVAPLTHMTRKDARVVWTAEAQEAVNKVIGALQRAPALLMWSPVRKARVTTDASLVGIGALLEQYVEEDSQWQPVAYWSRKLLPAQTRYHATDREWLAVVMAVTQTWWFWLRDRDFVLRTDHAPLKYLLQNPSPHLSHRQARWVEKMQPYRFEFIHLKGEANKVADALSRTPEFECQALEIHSAAQLHREELLSAARQDSSYACPPPLEGRSWEKKGDLWEIHLDGKDCIWVPNSVSLRAKLVSEHHETPMAGHLGIRKTYARLQERFRWPGMRKEVESFVRTCDVCQRAGHKLSEDVNVHTILARHPWEVVTIDFLCGFAPAKQTKHTSIVVITDKFTRQIHLRSCPLNPSASETVQYFLEMVVARHGLPRLLISDRGSQFESVLWIGVLQALGTRAALASTHHPQTNGATERANRTLIQMIRKFVRKNHSSWASYLPLFEFAYNSAVHAVTGTAPFVAELARMPLMPVSMLMPEKANPFSPRPVREHVSELMKQLQQIRQTILAKDEKVVDSRNLIPVGSDDSWSLLPGDEVLVHAPYLPIKAEYRKHLMAWKGPFVVAKEIAPDVFEIVGMEAGVSSAYHRSKLKRYQRSPNDPDRLFPSPSPLKFINGKVEYEIEEVVDHREVRGKRQYLLQWKNTPETSWEWEENLSGCLELLRDYLKHIGEQGRVLPPGLTSERPTSPSGGNSPNTLPTGTSSSSSPPQPPPVRSPTPPVPPPRRSTRLRRKPNPST